MRAKKPALTVWPLALTVVLLLVCYYPPSFDMLHKRRTIVQQLKRVDFIGMILFAVGLVLLLMGLNWGGSSYPWNSSHVVATIVVGTSATVAFVLYG